jgi:hypothetical protein
MLRFFIFSAVVFVVSISSVQATLSGSPQFNVLLKLSDFGIYRMIQKKDSLFDADTTAGYVSVIKTQLLEQSDVIPLKKDIVFGFNYAIADGSVDSQWVDVVVTVKHPETKDFTGHVSDGFSRVSAAKLRSDGLYHNSAFYRLSEPYEMVAGTWLIRVSYRDQWVVEKAFTVQ